MLPVDQSTLRPSLTTDGRRDAEAAPVPGVVLVFSNGSARAVPMRLVDGALDIGRADTTEGKLEDGRVSRRHARIALEGGRFVVTDLGSQNGTFVDGERLPPNGARPVGRVIRVGDSLLVHDARRAPARGARRPHHRRLRARPRPAGAARRGRARRRRWRHAAHSRRERHRQGGRGAAVPPSQPQRRRAVRAGQLRRRPAEPRRAPALRRQARRLLGRADRRRRLRAGGRRRHALPRRGGRARRGSAGQAPAHHRIARGHAARRLAPEQDRVPALLRHQ